jgi:hypothetical protein
MAVLKVVWMSIIRSMVMRPVQIICIKVITTAQVLGRGLHLRLRQVM